MRISYFKNFYLESGGKCEHFKPAVEIECFLYYVVEEALPRYQMLVLRYPM
jgi:hypothetical protein